MKWYISVKCYEKFGRKSVVRCSIDEARLDSYQYNICSGILKNILIIVIGCGLLFIPYSLYSHTK